MNSIVRVLLISLFAFQAPLFAAISEIDLTTIEGEKTSLNDQIKQPSTLVLIAKNEDEIRDAQRILTIPTETIGHHAIMLISLPSEKPLKEKLILHLAKDFFKSEFSRNRIFLTKSVELEHLTAKALVFVPGESTPIHEYDIYPKSEQPQ